MRAAPLTIERRRVLPFGHLWLELVTTECGAQRWALRVSDLSADAPGPAGPPIASGAVDDELRHDLVGLGPAVETFLSEVG